MLSCQTGPVCHSGEEDYLRKVASLVCDLCIQPEFVEALLVLPMGLQKSTSLERIMKFRVRADALRIQIVTHRTAEEKWFLRDGGKSVSKGIETDLSKIDAVNSDLSCGQLDESQQSLQAGAFPGTCEPVMDSADLLTKQNSQGVKDLLTCSADYSDLYRASTYQPSRLQKAVRRCYLFPR